MLTSECPVCLYKHTFETLDQQEKTWRLWQNQVRRLARLMGWRSSRAK